MSDPRKPSPAPTYDPSEPASLPIRELVLPGLLWSLLGLAVLATLAQVLVSIWGPIA